MPIVYMLTDEAMPGLVKIGMTDDTNPESRLSQLYSMGLPLPFEVQYACRVDNGFEVERALHSAFAPMRVNPRREFFRIDPSQAITILRLLDRPDATAELAHEVEPDPVSQQALRDARSRRPNLNFREMGIPVGAVLIADGNPDIRLVVTGDKNVHIGHGNEEWYLTAASREALNLEYDVRPAPFWRYNGRLLSEPYEETYLSMDS